MLLCYDFCGNEIVTLVCVAPLAQEDAHKKMLLSFLLE